MQMAFCKCTLLFHVQLFAYQSPQVLLCGAALIELLSESVHISVIALTQVQYPAFGLVELHVGVSQDSLGPSV